MDADTKIPFPEHETGNDVYVEVEPDQEYFVATRRVDNENNAADGKGESTLYLQIFVDGRSLGYYYASKGEIVGVAGSKVRTRWFAQGQDVPVRGRASYPAVRSWVTNLATSLVAVPSCIQ